MIPKCSLRTTQIFPTYTLLTRFVYLKFFVETHEISNLHTHTHTRWQKKDVLSGADLIHRYTFTVFQLFLGGRPRDPAPRRDFWTLTPYPSREVYSGRAPLTSRPPAPDGYYVNLRDVGVPSRNILHARGRGSKSRSRVADVVRGAGAPKISKKV